MFQKILILKQRLQQQLVTFHASGDFLRYVFQKCGKNLSRAILLKGILRPIFCVDVNAHSDKE